MNSPETYIAFTKQEDDLTIKKKLLLPEKVQLKPRTTISLLAHEARNPLTSINLAIAMLQSEIEDDSLKIYLEIITCSSIRISEMMNHIIQLQEISVIENRSEVYC